jgi:hypothetical protein
MSVSDMTDGTNARATMRALTGFVAVNGHAGLPAPYRPAWLGSSDLGKRLDEIAEALSVEPKPTD